MTYEKKNAGGLKGAGVALFGFEGVRGVLPHRIPVQNQLKAQRSGFELERRDNGAVRALGEAGSE